VVECVPYVWPLALWELSLRIGSMVLARYSFDEQVIRETKLILPALDSTPLQVPEVRPVYTEFWYCCECGQCNGNWLSDCAVCGHSCGDDGKEDYEV
jgi:hypothetical protein